ncbi:Endonuclease/exonuclease/phosphatase [Schizophyllum amplum]|uniref:Endonuclease/exonuclease/phosphatase n=1 Tax=Schizophyllum amplum TaxID=97359 RepID=A0A550CD33_9AGAR|nr:Endonuclease/exonuclease/phosphatase [Auriculariopsis ampla]
MSADIQTPPPDHKERLLVQIASYNTALQGLNGVPQDLVDWLSPTLQVSHFLSRERRAADIVAVGFQELLPLYLGLAGLSKSVIESRHEHILAEIEGHAPNKEKYSLVAKMVNGGVALLVYALDEGVARRVTDVHTSYSSCGPGYMANKGAVGVRFRVAGDDGGLGETFTFVCAHLTAHAEKVAHRVADFHHIVGTLLFPPSPGASGHLSSTIYDTSHLFFFGDLNFRLDIPPADSPAAATAVTLMDDSEQLHTLKAYDQLTNEKQRRTAFLGFHEGEFWKFKATYKCIIGAVDRYNPGRVPAWTDRILYATYSDDPSASESNIANILYTSIPSYTTSDHKPVVSLLLLPAPMRTNHQIPVIQLPPSYHASPDPWMRPKRYTGLVLDKVVGITWWLFTLFGMGSAIVGIFNTLLGFGAWRWYSLWSSSLDRSTIV